MFRSPFFSGDPGFKNFDVFGFFLGDSLAIFYDFGNLALATTVR